MTATPSPEVPDGPARVVLEDFRPVSESLEWRIGAAYWADAGVRAFMADEVPHIITNDGMLAARDADVLFESCALAERCGALEPAIGAVELGCGGGIYAHQFLDRFAARCERAGRDYYERLTLHVTDDAGAMLDDIVATRTLDAHRARVRLGRIDALDCATFDPHDGGPTETLGGLRAVLCSYVLDCLPFDIVLRSGETWLRLHYRTSIAAADADPGALALEGEARSRGLLAAAPRLDVEHAYFAVELDELPYGDVLAAHLAASGPPDGTPRAGVTHSHGALRSLTSALEALRDDGFVLLHDYGHDDATAGLAGHQRFGRSRAVALNFALIDTALPASVPCRVLAPVDEPRTVLRTRLVCAGGAELEGAFRASYDMTVFRRLGALVEQARALRRSDAAAARAAYGAAQRLAPENWYVLVDWADFELGIADDPDAALALALRAARMNPSGAPVIHAICGDAHAATGGLAAAASAYREALRLYPEDVRAAPASPGCMRTRGGFRRRSSSSAPRSHVIATTRIATSCSPGSHRSSTCVRPPPTESPCAADTLRAVAPIIFSGIQPTGRKHLGNYIGAITQYVAGQDRGDPAIYCIVDLHATSLPYDPAELRDRLLDTTALLIAAGLDPERCILFRQGDVAEHSELCWLLSSVTAVGELHRMHQFRDKSRGAARARLGRGAMYPVLQAADVLAYRAHEVPVGEDQREHLELMRDVARRFNSRFAHR